MLVRGRASQQSESLPSTSTTCRQALPDYRKRSPTLQPSLPPSGAVECAHPLILAVRETPQSSTQLRHGSLHDDTGARGSSSSPAPVYGMLGEE